MNKNTIAVSFSDFNNFGCVYCGCDYCYNASGVSGGGSADVKCGECGDIFIVLADGLEKSLAGYGTGRKDEFFYPEKQEHPRKSIPKHKFVKPDEKPDEGEFFNPRGVGYDLAGFVKTKQSGERIIQMFKEVLKQSSINTWLDYREHEPTWIQVKIQEFDGIDLEKLYSLTSEEGIITKDIIKQCLKKELKG
jgi:hypothetical protein